MSILEAVVLGIVQGITEFLPISSDGHLILVPSLLGWKRLGLGFDVMLHFGTLLATIAYFRKDVLELARALFSSRPELARPRRLAWLLVGATIPSVIVVLGLETFVSGVEDLSVSRQLVITAWGLLATSALLAGSELLAKRHSHTSDVDTDDGSVSTPNDEPAKSEDLPWYVALGIGFAQGFAALPGLSRSGTTIATGQALGMEKSEAARFSFLLSLPIISAAVAKKMLDLSGGEGVLPPTSVTVVGVVVTAVVGYFAIAFLLPFVRKHSLGWFAAYAGIAGILLLVTQSGIL